jgi:O-antigen biosynthesis protein WbqP
VFLYKRMFDVVLALLLLVLLWPLFLVLALIIRLTSPGPVLHWSVRVGRENKLFRMPKLRSMRIDTPQVATHLLADPELYLTPIGRILRRTSLDELPQLFSILKGDLSFVGPRPALYNQDDLVAMRTERGIHQLVPGLTGWAQINGRDELPVPAKVDRDEEYLQLQSLLFDLYILIVTAIKVVPGQGVLH